MKLETERDVTEWVYAAKALAMVSAWTELGLFERLRSGPCSVQELPADARALAVTVPVLKHLGLLVGDADRVGLSPVAERLLGESAMPTGRNLELLADLGRSAEVLREGGPVPNAQGHKRGTRGGTVPDDREGTARFLEMLHRMSEQPARSTFEWLSPLLPAGGAVLDLGGGHGRYARAFADAGYAVTLYDQPVVVELARERHGDALSYLAGDFHREESFGGPYDLVLLCNVVHGESDAANASLIARAARSVRPGGHVALRDMFLDEHGTNPASAVFFGTTMLFYTDHGRSPSLPQVQAWFEAAGLEAPRICAFETHQIVVGRRR